MTIFCFFNGLLPGESLGYPDLKTQRFVDESEIVGCHTEIGAVIINELKRSETRINPKADYRVFLEPLLFNFGKWYIHFLRVFLGILIW